MAYYEKKDWPSDKIQQLLCQVSDHFDMEDVAVRQRQIRVCRQLKLLWNNYTNVWYDEVAHDWRIYDPAQAGVNDDDQQYYDKNVNIFRAYLESIIAALSVTVPSVTCYPDDAENNLDIQTAKAGDKIAQLISRHNEVSYLWLHALYLYCTEGLVAAYDYAKADKRFGSYEEKREKQETELKYICPQCQTELDQAMFNTPEATQNSVNPVVESSNELEAFERDEFQPSSEDVALHDAYAEEDESGGLVCPHCAVQLDPALQKTPFVVTRIVGVTQKAKSRVCLEAYGLLNVKVPNYARTQEECPYLRYSYETHYSTVMEMFPHLVDELGEPRQNLTGLSDPYEAWGRLSPQYNGEYPINTATVNHYWFRPSAFNILSEDECKILKKKYPDGVQFSKVNECFAGACNASLDDYWTLTRNPLSDYIHFDPLGLLLTSIQDIINELISLILQTIEHGISQGFADPSVLNFSKYRQTEVRPGDIFPAVAKSGKNLSEFFHEIKTASLSPEVIPFYQLVQELGQLTTGALPSLFGGQLEGSKTASEYSMSRSQALQRLQTPWKMLLIWWKEIFGKAIPLYMKISVEDEKFVEKDTYGNFVNVFIRKAEMQGKLGSVEIEGNENIPLTWNQQQDVVMRILQAGNPELLQALLAPQNMPTLKKAIGLVDFEIPGENDRNKEFEEIQQLMDSEPIPTPSMDGMGMEEMPSVEVDFDLDNHQIGADIDRNWLISEAGRLARVDRPLGYKNVLLHFKMHLQALQQQMMEQQHAAAVEAGEAPGDPKSEEGKAMTNGSGKTSKGQNGSGVAPKENEDSNGERVTVN